jgi:5-methylcytosine-specific restriction endonuclease McrA
MQPVYARWISCRSRSRARGFDFDLTMEDVEVLMNAPCHYCGDKNNPQIDRKDNARGYTRDNVVPACKRCNTVKGHLLTYEEMLKVIDALEWRK